MIFAIAWRNLWRNPRRFLLTAGAIAFAEFLMIVFVSMQVGQYAVMVDNATGMLTGHGQVQHPEYDDNPLLRRTVPDAANLRAALRADPAVAAAVVRSQAHALLSAGQRTSGALVIGIEPESEGQFSTLPRMISAGRPLAAGDTGVALLGAGVARALGIDVGGELLILGNDRDGSLAALALTVVGLVESPQIELNRSIAIVPLADFTEAFQMGTGATLIALRFNQPSPDEATLARLRGMVGGSRLLTWQELLPELEQAIELDWLGGQLIYGLLAVMVVFSIFNTFVMIVFERTRELGVLLALGARPGFVLLMLQLESLFLCLCGAVVGLVTAVAVILWLGSVGIFLGDEASAMMAAFHMPERLYPTLEPSALIVPPMLVLVAMQLASVLPALRVVRLVPAAAVRGED